MFNRRTDRMLKLGSERFWNLIYQYGGGYFLENVPIEEYKLVDLIMNEKIIHLDDGNRTVIPKFQFDESGNFIDGVSEVMDYKPDWTMEQFCIFLLRRIDPRENEEKPIDLLKYGDVSHVCHLADTFNEQRP